jgi:hypothetical protein
MNSPTVTMATPIRNPGADLVLAVQAHFITITVLIDAATQISWNLFESRMLRLKQAFPERRGPNAADRRLSMQVPLSMLGLSVTASEIN